MCFSFSAWGESLFMSVQTTFLVVMYFYYTKKAVLCVLFPVLYGSIFYALVSGLTPMSVLVQLVSMQVVFVIISRVCVCFGYVLGYSARNSITPILLKGNEHKNYCENAFKRRGYLICVCSCQISSFGKLYWKSESFKIVESITYVI